MSSKVAMDFCPQARMLHLMQEDGLNRERTLVKMHVACARRVVAVLVTAAPRVVPNIGTAEPSAHVDILTETP